MVGRRHQSVIYKAFLYELRHRRRFDRGRPGRPPTAQTRSLRRVSAKDRFSPLADLPRGYSALDFIHLISAPLPGPVVCRRRRKPGYRHIRLRAERTAGELLKATPRLNSGVIWAAERYFASSRAEKTPAAPGAMATTFGSAFASPVASAASWPASAWACRLSPWI